MSTGNPPAGGNGGWGAPPAGGSQGGWGTPPAAPQGGSQGGWGGSTPPAAPQGGSQGGWGGSTTPAAPQGGSQGGWGAPPAAPQGGSQGGWGGSTPPSGPQGGGQGGWGGSSAGGNNGGWNPPPGGTPTPPRSGSGCLKVAIGLVVLSVLAIGGLVAIGLSLPSNGKANLVSVVVENRSLADGTPQAVMIVTLTALEAPEDPAMLTSDLVVVGTSTAFSSDVVVSWDQLANADKDPATVAGSPPVLNTPYVFEHVIESNLMTNINTYSEGVTMSVELKWNGSRMDSDTVSITHLYEFN